MNQFVDLIVKNTSPTVFPRSENSFTVPQNVKVKGVKLVIPKFQEGIEMIMESKIEGEIKKATLSRTPTGKYFVSVLSEKE